MSPTPQLQSFAVPILNVADSRVTAPWFGANKWEAIIQPVQGGGIPPQHSELDLVLEFKEGGAFDFASIFERLKERLRQAIDLARESGSGGDVQDGTRGVGGININNVHLEDLPAYQEESDGPLISPVLPLPTQANLGAPAATGPLSSAAPAEPPPGYEETQMQGLQDEAERTH